LLIIFNAGKEALMQAVNIQRHGENLLARKKKVGVVLEHLRREGGEVTGTRHFDWVDQAWDESDAHTIDRLIDVYERELASIDRAIGRIEAGTFGSCFGCHRPIDPSRLEVFPQAEFCRGCGEFREAFERAA
jgi:RNA polymerase-binding transcription factor DksA